MPRPKKFGGPTPVYLYIQDGLWRDISRNFAGKDFTNRDVAKVTKMNEKVILRHLWQFYKQGLLTIAGPGRPLRFRVRT